MGPILHGQHGQRAADVALDERGLLALLFRGLAPGCCGLGLCHRLLPSSSLAPPSPGGVQIDDNHNPKDRSEEHTSELQSLMRISYAVFCLTKQKQTTNIKTRNLHLENDDDNHKVDRQHTRLKSQKYSDSNTQYVYV